MRCRTIRRAAAALALALCFVPALTGCEAPDLIRSPETLYRLPELPVRYNALNRKLAAVLESGAEYAPPVSGANIQPVQMVDLDGDGREEAVAFFRRAGEEKPLRIQLFTAGGDGYEEIASIAGSGTAIYSVSYSDLDGDGRTEILAGWRISAELQVLSVYGVGADGAQELLLTDYTRYAVSDLDGDGRRELTVLRGDQTGACVAECYRYVSGAMEPAGSVQISSTVSELTRQGRIQPGVLREGRNALFVTGVAPDAWAVTDILILDEVGLTNITVSDATGVSALISPWRSLYPGDVNGDGFTDVPRSIFAETAEGQRGEYLRTEWSSYDAAGAAELHRVTYHATEDGWYFQTPETWAGRVTAERAVLSEETAVTFYLCDENGQAVRPVLRISALTGAGRERIALRAGRIVLSRQAGAIYTAELPEGAAGWEYGLDADAIRAAFALIPAEWSAYDY